MKGAQIGSLEVITVDGGVEFTEFIFDTSLKGWQTFSGNIQLNSQTQASLSLSLSLSLSQNDKIERLFAV